MRPASSGAHLCLGQLAAEVLHLLLGGLLRLPLLVGLALQATNTPRSAQKGWCFGDRHRVTACRCALAAIGNRADAVVNVLEPQQLEGMGQHVCVRCRGQNLTFSSWYLGRRRSTSLSADSAAERALTAFLLASSSASLMRCSRLDRPSASSFGPLRLASCSDGNQMTVSGQEGNKLRQVACFPRMCKHARSLAQHTLMLLSTGSISTREGSQATGNCSSAPGSRPGRAGPAPHALPPPAPSASRPPAACMRLEFKAHCTDVVVAGIFSCLQFQSVSMSHLSTATGNRRRCSAAC
jgi:hypothetical protein